LGATWSVAQLLGRRGCGLLVTKTVDMRDEVDVAKLITAIVQDHGKIDGAIHGAGVIEDKLLRDKTPESFDRVFGTKVDSAAHLIKHLPPSGLKFLSLFASIASRYGNRGQSDYAAANEVLSKLAAKLDRLINGLIVKWRHWEIPVSASFGVETYGARSRADGLLFRADRALYRRKRDSDLIEVRA